MERFGQFVARIPRGDLQSGCPGAAAAPFDMTKGKITQQADSLSYRLRTR